MNSYHYTHSYHYTPFNFESVLMKHFSAQEIFEAEQAEVEFEALEMAKDEDSEFYFASERNVLEAILEAGKEFNESLLKMLIKEDYAGIGMMIEIQSVEYWTEMAKYQIQKMPR